VLGYESRTPATAGVEDQRPTVSVTHWRRKPSAGVLVPTVGQSVMGRVTRITAGVVNVDIICVDHQVLPAPSAGVIRVEDVFPADVDHTAVQMTNCFRPGDAIRARIMAMGDSRQYFLSTAAPDLGVAWTRDASGDVMVRRWAL
jgi:exosome complex component CSL4